MGASLGAAISSSVCTAASPLVSQIEELNGGSLERYDGNLATCDAFLCNCAIIFSLQPLAFSLELVKMAYTVNNLMGRETLRGTTERMSGTSACRSFRMFADEFRKVFGTGLLGADAGRELLDLVQGSQSITDYTIDF